jgi:dethiobiotin synthetase
MPNLLGYYFVTGTDTGIGKTYVTCQLLRQLQKENKTAIGIKPIQSGPLTEDADVALLMKHNSIALPQNVINPYTFDLATSPHIAAKHQGITITADEVVSACQPVLEQKVDVVLIEGIGGWNVPINDTETTVDIAKKLKCPVILVVGLRLGCLNHALLPADAIKAQNIPLAGWVANQIDPNFAFEQEYLASLKSRILAPMLMYVNYRNIEKDLMGF